MGYRQVTIVFLLIIPKFVFASLVISEVMYDASGSDTDREWIEIHNDGSSPVTIVTGSGSGSWRISDSSAHIINSEGASNTIVSDGYAIIAKSAGQFKIDYPNYSGVLFSSSISLPNTSATLSLKDGDQNILDSISYSSDRGGGGDGNTLHRSGISWTSGSPTPGSGDPGATAPIQTQTTSLIPTSAPASSVVVDSPYVDRQTNAFTVHVSKERNGVINAPVYFMATTDPDTYEDQTRFTWSFGDGSTGSGQSVQHAYLLPGKYVATVRAAASPGFSVANIGVNISDFPIEFGDYKTGVDGYITLVNKSGGDLYLSGLSLTMGAQIYTFPVDFVLGVGELKLPARVTGLALYDGKSVELRDTYGKIVLTKDIANPKQEAVKPDAIVATPVALARQVVTPIKQSAISSKIVIQTPASPPVAPVLVIERKSSLLSDFVALPRRVIGSIMGLFN